jgi:hypothetical protein
MGTMRGGLGGMGGRMPSGRHGLAGVRAGRPDPPKKKISLKKVGPEVWALMAPRKGLILQGFA